jgi:hypothetical protein
MTTMLRDGRYRNAAVARPTFGVAPARADQLLAVLQGCARPMREVYA